MANTILKTEKLELHWNTENPFLFCANHKEIYPKGNDDFGPPAESLVGRSIGNDFSIKDGWSMYHGRKVPGFPVHPHRGFETVTVVLEGFVDHSDSHGAAGRYGNGDVQWMTAGSGLQHSEMFPLLDKDKENPLHILQIWLNLPKKDKFTDPVFKMLWAEEVPVIEESDNNGKKISIRLVAGKYKDVNALEPAPASWAHEKNNLVNIWLVNMEPNATIKIPKVNSTITRNLYCFKGGTLTINDNEVEALNRFKLDGNTDITLENGDKPSQMLLLEGEPINEPIAKYGPFVMNTMEEIQQAASNYRATGFGGWPWDRNDPVHSGEKTRFAKYADGTVEKR